MNITAYFKKIDKRAVARKCALLARKKGYFTISQLSDLTTQPLNSRTTLETFVSEYEWFEYRQNGEQEGIYVLREKKNLDELFSEIGAKYSVTEYEEYKYFRKWWRWKVGVENNNNKRRAEKA